MEDDIMGRANGTWNTYRHRYTRARDCYRLRRRDGYRVARGRIGGAAL